MILSACVDQKDRFPLLKRPGNWLQYFEFCHVCAGIMKCLVALLYSAISSALWIKTKTPWQAIKSILFDRALEFAEHFLRTEKRHHLFPGSLIWNHRLPGRQCLTLPTTLHYRLLKQSWQNYLDQYDLFQESTLKIIFTQKHFSPSCLKLIYINPKYAFEQQISLIDHNQH